MQERLNMLLKKYGVSTAATLVGDRSAAIDGKDIPLLPWRYERRFEELKKLVDSKTVDGISVFRIISIGRKTDSMDELLTRELDVCRYVLSTEIKEVFAIGNGAALNVSLKLDSGVVCTIELATTLPEAEERISKHEVITARGIACDMNVDTQVMQSSVYVYGDKSQKYTDVDYELFGLDTVAVSTVRAAFAAAKEPAVRDLFVKESAALAKLVATVKQSAEALDNIIL